MYSVAAQTSNMYLFDMIMFFFIWISISAYSEAAVIGEKNLNRIIEVTVEVQ